jgi:hypothetical protein
MRESGTHFQFVAPRNVARFEGGRHGGGQRQCIPHARIQGPLVAHRLAAIPKGEFHVASTQDDQTFAFDFMELVGPNTRVSNQLDLQQLERDRV